MQLNSYLKLSRHGIYYLRIQRDGVDRRISLRTKNPSEAAVAAYRFGATISAMKNKTTPITFATPEDLALMAECEARNRAWARIEELTLRKREDDIFNAMLAENEPLRAFISSNQPAPSIAPTQEQLSQILLSAVNKQAPAPASVPTLLSICLRDAVDKYGASKDILKTKKGVVKPVKSVRQAKATLEDLVARLGADFDMALLNDEVVEIKWLEPRLIEVADVTAKRDLSFIRSFVEWAADTKRKYCPAPLSLSIFAEGGHREYFNSGDLKAIFDALPLNADNAWRFWIPLIGLYTGARISEPAALRVDHFFMKMDLNVMHLPGTKTDSSPRDVPIHPDLITLGLLDYVKSRKDAGNALLFDITISEQNGAGAAMSKWFGVFLRETAKIVDKQKVFHSFRPTIVDLLRQFGANYEARCQYVGHDSGGGVHNKVYGRKELGIQMLQDEVVSKINWQNYCGWSPNLTALKGCADKFI